MPTELLDEGYRYFPLDVTSLFTNVPLVKLLTLFYTEYTKKKQTNMRESTLE